MPKRGQSDRSPGDARKPFSDEGGPEARHAKTHDVRREAHTNPKGPQPRGEEFTAEIMAQSPPAQHGGHPDESRPADEDKALHTRLAVLDRAELAQVRVLEPGTQLQQGAIYLDLNDLERRPFKAMGGQEVRTGDRYIAKRDVDYDLWNRLVGEDSEVEVERPRSADA